VTDSQPRESLFERDLLYLFSLDADVEMRRDQLGFVPGGVRMNVFAKPDKTRVYHVERERSTLGFKSVQGTISAGVDRIFLREDDVGIVNVQLSIETDDGADIHATYRGVFPAGQRGYRRLISKKPKLGTETEPFVARAFVAPRFETNSRNYSWLMQYQCVGFSCVTVIESIVREVSVDIYAMD
jgi:hypothetical protein